LFIAVCDRMFRTSRPVKTDQIKMADINKHRATQQRNILYKFTINVLIFVTRTFIYINDGQSGLIRRSNLEVSLADYEWRTFSCVTYGIISRIFVRMATQPFTVTPELIRGVSLYSLSRPTICVFYRSMSHIYSYKVSLVHWNSEPAESTSISSFPLDVNTKTMHGNESSATGV
jgi:hypothetical protein